MTDVQDKHIVVIGAARSGLAAASLLKQKGGRVFVTDNAEIEPSVKTILTEQELPFEEKE